MNKEVKYVINPLTQRPIKKNGKSYYNLLEDGILPSDEKDEKPIDKNIICVIKDMEKKEIEILRKEYNDNNPIIIRNTLLVLVEVNIVNIWLEELGSRQKMNSF
jgi:hypothetical protein